MKAIPFPTALILAGGLGTRLGQASGENSKVMAEVGGRPFLEILLEMLVSKGIHQFVLCVGHKGSEIKSHFNSGSRFNAEIAYSFDSDDTSDKTIGTGQAIQKALKTLPEKFWVMNGDTYQLMCFDQMAESFRSQPSEAMIAVFKNKNEFWPSNLSFLDGRVSAYRTKVAETSFEYIHTGIGLYSKSFWERFQYTELTDALEHAALTGSLAGYEVEKRFYEINTAESLNELRQFLSAPIKLHS